MLNRALEFKIGKVNYMTTAIGAEHFKSPGNNHVRKRAQESLRLVKEGETEICGPNSALNAFQ